MQICIINCKNSSSSNFIIARKGKLTEEQKAAIIEFVEQEFLGEKVLTSESTESEIKEAFDKMYVQKILRCGCCKLVQK